MLCKGGFTLNFQKSASRGADQQHAIWRPAVAVETLGLLLSIHQGSTVPPSWSLDMCLADDMGSKDFVTTQDF